MNQFRRFWIETESDTIKKIKKIYRMKKTKQKNNQDNEIVSSHKKFTVMWLGSSLYFH